MAEKEEDDKDDGEEELGGLFHVSRPDKESKLKANGLDCSKFAVEVPQDWDLEEVLLLGRELLHSVLLRPHSGLH